MPAEIERAYGICAHASTAAFFAARAHAVPVDWRAERQLGTSAVSGVAWALRGFLYDGDDRTSAASRAGTFGVAVGTISGARG